MSKSEQSVLTWPGVKEEEYAKLQETAHQPEQSAHLVLLRNDQQHTKHVSPHSYNAGELVILWPGNKDSLLKSVARIHLAHDSLITEQIGYSSFAAVDVGYMPSRGWILTPAVNEYPYPLSVPEWPKTLTLGRQEKLPNGDYSANLYFNPQYIPGPSNNRFGTIEADTFYRLISRSHVSFSQWVDPEDEQRSFVRIEQLGQLPTSIDTAKSSMLVYPDAQQVLMFGNQ